MAQKIEKFLNLTDDDDDNSNDDNIVVEYCDFKFISCDMSSRNAMSTGLSPLRPRPLLKSSTLFSKLLIIFYFFDYTYYFGRRSIETTCFLKFICTR